jgi:hypothetical protein
MFPVVLHGYKTWSVTLREEKILRVFENRVLRKTFGPYIRRGGAGENFTSGFIICVLLQLLLVIKSRRME